MLASLPLILSTVFLSTPPFGSSYTAKEPSSDCLSVPLLSFEKSSCKCRRSNIFGLCLSQGNRDRQKLSCKSEIQCQFFIHSPSRGFPIVIPQHLKIGVFLKEVALERSTSLCLILYGDIFCDSSAVNIFLYPCSKAVT